MKKDTLKKIVVFILSILVLTFLLFGESIIDNFILPLFFKK